MSAPRRLVSWGVLLIAVWLAFSFVTYDPSDDASSGSNLGGPVGRFISSTLVEGFGIGAFALCFYLALWGYLIQVKRTQDRLPLRLVGLTVCMFCFGAFWQALFPDRAFPGASVPLGGMIGDWAVVRVGATLGGMGTLATMGVGMIAGLLLATGSMVPEMLRRGDTAADTDQEENRSMRRRLAERLKAAIGSGAPETEEEEADEEEGREIEDEEAPDDGEEEEYDDEEEEYEEEEYEYEEDDDGDYEDDDEAEEAPPSREKLPPPKITQAAKPTSADGIQVIKLQREAGVPGDLYDLPPLPLLAEPRYIKERESDAFLQQRATALEEALQDFNVTARVDEIERGPVITRFDLTLERGTKISKVTNLSDDLALALGVARVRIAPVKGKSALGVEIPNGHRETVFLRELAVAMAEDMDKRKIAIPLFLGKDASGHPIIEDLATTPHLLIAGRTGAGKSVFVNGLILSILLTRYPEECRLIMIDPKKVELEVYQDIPHLLTKVESSPKKATKILDWAVNQMEERYELLATTGVRHLTSYNKLKKKIRRDRLLTRYSESEVDKLPEHMPYVVIIVDELADLMMAAGKEVEQAIARLAQKARAVGIHVVLATQRPSTDVITGLIKSNLPARIGFQTRTGIDSRTILDRQGAEKLLDKGDMLYLSSTSDDPRRIQGPFVSDQEVEDVVSHLKKHASPHYTPKLEQVENSGNEVARIFDEDELFEQAVDVMFASGMASASGLQRRLKVGYARASRLIDLMADAGIVSEHRGSKAREILMSPEQWEEMRHGAGSSTNAP